MCLWTHEKKTFFSYQRLTRSGGVGQGRAILRAAQRAKRLDGRWSGGYFGDCCLGRTSASLLFSSRYAQFCDSLKAHLHMLGAMFYVRSRTENTRWGDCGMARRGRRRSWLIYTSAIMDIRKILHYRVYLALVLLYAIAVVALCSLAPAVQQPVQLRLDEVSQGPAPSSSQDPYAAIAKPIDQISRQSANRRAPLWALGAGFSLDSPLFAEEQAELIGLVLLAALVYRFRLRFMTWGAAIATFVGSRRRGTCVWLAFLIVLLLTTFPPWVQVITFPGRFPARHIKLWHAPIFREPYPTTTRWDSIQLDYARMLTEIAVGESFVLALYLTWARTKPK